MHASIVCLLGVVSRNAQSVSFYKVADDWQIKLRARLMLLLLLLLLLLLENLLQMHCSCLTMLLMPLQCRSVVYKSPGLVQDRFTL
jgi:hypothetical protein